MKRYWVQLFCCWLISCTSLWAQTAEGLPEQVNLKQNLVVATTGLSIREAPRLSAKRLGVVPFGKTVDIRSTKVYGTDTLGQQSFTDWGNIKETQTPYQVPLAGQWVKVRYGRLEGYVFNAYLIEGTSMANHPDVLNQTVALLMPGENCLVNLFYHHQWHWYGLYELETGYQMRPVQPTFTKSWAPHAEVTISTKDNIRLRYIIGSKTPLEIPKAPRNLVQPGEGEFWKAGPVQRPESVYAHGLSAEPCEAPCSHTPLYLLGEEGQILQTLNPEALQLQAPSQLRWCGDLDGDGRLDYIILYEEEAGTLVLYLSRLAPKGQYLKAVAAYYWGLCC